MFERLFPRALLVCIREGRSPHAHELASMADKLWDEALAPRERETERSVAADMARVALEGDQPAEQPPLPTGRRRWRTR